MYRVWYREEGDIWFNDKFTLDVAIEQARSKFSEGFIDATWVTDMLTGTIVYNHEQDKNGEIKVNYTSSPTRNKIAEIKAVRAVSDLGLREAKELVESMSSIEVAAWVMEHVYSATMDFKNKASQYDDLKASNDRYMQEATEMRKVRYSLEKENKNLLHQRNAILVMLTKEQILDLYIASQSQTE